MLSAASGSGDTSDPARADRNGQPDVQQEGSDLQRSDSGTASESSNEAARYLERASAHMHAGKNELAVGELSSGLKCCKSPELEYQLLVKRSEAFCTISKNLREIPAAQSERRAIYAPDPCHLACMGLKDALGALHISPESSEALLRKAHALLLLEKYGEAEAAAQRAQELGLGDERLLEALQKVLSGCQAALEGGETGAGKISEACCSRKRQRLLQRDDEADCILCLKLLYEPVTTPCGHTFCRPCFARAADHCNRCPMCRTVLHVGRELPVTVTLKALLERSFPQEYAARRLEESGTGCSAGSEGGAETPVPLFVMSPSLLPGEKMALNIFEPRYRLMVRRCMEGGRRFGMATIDSRHELHPVACECEITECQPLPDGRFYLEVAGRRRFEPQDMAEQDGYRVARPRYISDDPVLPDTPQHQELAAVAGEVEGLADGWVTQLKSMAQSRRGIAELLQRAGDKPPQDDLEHLSFWVANLACPLLDDPSSKLQFLTTTSTLDRFKLGREVLAQLRDTHSPGCSIM